ncbi:MAG: hypothetical protein IJO13_09105 [Lachnospiraceae bacterium]|nr:hypothetical protein [Lachnospiraceae bacterium]
MRKILKLIYLGILLLFLFFLAEIHNKKEQIMETAEQEVFVSATDNFAAQEVTDYNTYIPVYENGVENNLYDLISKEQIIYVKRDVCEDCKMYHNTIINRLNELGYPYLVIEASKEAELYENGYAIPSPVIRAIGISKVPTLVFIKDNQWVEKIEDEFTITGTEIDAMCRKVFQ